MRQKSNRTLLIEQERAARKEERERKKAEKERDKNIREDRRERKQAEREAKREIRLEKQRVHESVVRNGVPKVRPEESRFGLREAIVYSPLVLCGGCGAIVRDSAIIGNLCPKCKYGKEVQSAQHEGRQTQGDAPTGVHDGPLEAQDERRRT